MKKKQPEPPKVISDNPLKNSAYKDFIKQTEGRENKGGDSRAENRTKASLSEREAREQSEALKEFVKRTK